MAGQAGRNLAFLASVLAVLRLLRSTCGPMDADETLSESATDNRPRTVFSLSPLLLHRRQRLQNLLQHILLPLHPLQIRIPLPTVVIDLQHLEVRRIRHDELNRRPYSAASSLPWHRRSHSSAAHPDTRARSRRRFPFPARTPPCPPASPPDIVHLSAVADPQPQ